MKRSREEEPAPDLPGSLWHALARLQRTHPDPVVALSRGSDALCCRTARRVQPPAVGSHAAGDPG